MPRQPQMHNKALPDLAICRTFLHSTFLRGPPSGDALCPPHADHQCQQ